MCLFCRKVCGFPADFSGPGAARTGPGPLGQGARTAYQKTHAPGDTILTTVSGSGYTIVQIYIDNRLIQEMRP